MICQHIRHVTETLTSTPFEQTLKRAWCLDCPHTWVELPLNMQPVKKESRRESVPRSTR